MARTEVVQIDPASQFGERCDIRNDDVIVGLSHHIFQDFDRKPFGL